MRNRIFSCLLVVTFVAIVGCSAGSDATNLNPGGSIVEGDTSIVWTDSTGRVLYDGDSTDWQPRLDYEGQNQVGIMPYFPNPTAGKGGLAFRVHKQTYIEMQLDTTVLFSQY